MSTPIRLDYASVLPYQEYASSINNVLGVTNTVSDVIIEDVHIFHQLFVNVDDPDSVSLMKDVVLGERDAAIFEQAKMQDTCRTLQPR